MKSTFEKTRKVYLAEPANRLDFWAVRTLAGGQTIDAAAPHQTMPLHIRADSILPMRPACSTQLTNLPAT